MVRVQAYEYFGEIRYISTVSSLVRAWVPLNFAENRERKQVQHSPFRSYLSIYFSGPRKLSKNVLYTYTSNTKSLTTHRYLIHQINKEVTCIICKLKTLNINVYFVVTEYNYIYSKNINLSRGTAFPTRSHVHQAMTQSRLRKSAFCSCAVGCLTSTPSLDG